MFYGWWIVITGMTCLLLAGGIGFYSFGVFFSPLMKEFGWTRGEISLAMTLSCLAGLSGILVGNWVDRYGVKKVMLLGSSITGGSLALLGFTSSLWQFYVFYLALGFGEALTLEIPVTKMVSSWFLEKKGLAIGVAITGFGLGGLLMPPMVSYLVAFLGWRFAYHLSGLLVLAILIPLCAILIKERPGGKGKDLSIPDFQNQWTLKEALRTKTYPFILAAMILAYLGIAGFIAHIIPFLEDKGFSPQLAAAVLGIISGVSILGRIIGGYIADRLPVKHVSAILLSLQAIGFFLLKVGLANAIWAFVPLFGLGMGGIFAIEPLLVSQYFGITSLGRLYGGLWGLTAFSFAVGPPLAGYIFDITKSYHLALSLFITTTILALLLIIRLPKSLK